MVDQEKKNPALAVAREYDYIHAHSKKLNDLRSHLT
jgi:hypothetical protein